MIKVVLLLSLFLIFICACSTDKVAQADSSSVKAKTTQDSLENKKENNGNELKKADVSSKEEIDENEKRNISIKNDLGLIALNNKYPNSKDEIKNKNDFVRFYNEDESLWYEFTFYYDDSDGKFEYQNDEFRAFAFHPDHFLLNVRAVGEDLDRYEVIVNEETGLKKYVRKSDKNLKLEKWSEHILRTFAIDLEKGKNQLFESPNDKEIKIDFEQIERFQAVEVKDDWLKVKWEVPNKTAEHKNAWVRWKKDDIILIDWFYIS